MCLDFPWCPAIRHVLEHPLCGQIISAYPEKWAAQELYFYTFRINKLNCLTSESEWQGVFGIDDSSLNLLFFFSSSLCTSNTAILLEKPNATLVRIPQPTPKKVGNLIYPRMHCSKPHSSGSTHPLPREEGCLQKNHKGWTLLPKDTQAPSSSQALQSRCTGHGLQKAHPKRLCALLEITPAVLSCFR